ncbi:MAG: MFS transporter, partial [Bdellovibrionota bacterium]
TLMCGLANTYEMLVAARLITGIFGGVIGSIIFAIVTDLFPIEKRGRVMGFVQTAFAASQVLGLPAGLYISNVWGWHAPFMMIVGVSAVAGIAIFSMLRPIDEHLKLQTERNPFRHLFATVTKPRYILGFSATGLLMIGGFMIMPFGSAFAVNNVGIHADKLPLIYLFSGLSSIVIGPLVGRASDTFGNFRVFLFGTVVSIAMVLIYTQLGITSLPLFILINIIMFVGIFSRMIPSQTLMSAIPAPASRGAYMSVSSSLQQLAGGLASIFAGLIVVEAPGGRLERFDVVGYVVAATAVVALFMMYLIYRLLPDTRNAKRGAARA